MKLCILGNPNSIHVIRWARDMAHRGHDVHLVGTRPCQAGASVPTPFYDATKNLAGIPRLRYLGWALQTRKFVGEIQPEIVHAHHIDSGGWLAAATGFHPLVMTAHGSDLLLLKERGFVNRSLTRWALRQADYVHCVSTDLAAAAEQIGAPHDRIETLPLGVDTSIFTPEQASRQDMPEAIRSHVGPLVLHLRSLRPVYNPLAVAHAIPRILRQFPEARFVVLTRGADPAILQNFERILQEASALHAVIFLPSVTDDATLAGIYARADVAISVARSDGLPISVLEAMACETALVLGDIPAFRGWIRHEREALLVAADDGAAIGDAVIRLLSEQPLRHALARQARMYVDDHFDRNKTLARVEQVYARLAGQSGHR